MFLDSSALVAIILGEPDMPQLRAKLKASRRYTSAIVIYESAMAVMRNSQKSIAEAQSIVDEMLKAYRIQVLPIDGRHAALALETFDRFGRGKHPAKLNMGDCFSYASARIQNVPLLFKGNDFGRTDIRIA